MLFGILASLPLLVAAWLLAQPWLTARRRERIRRRPFPAAWRAILRERVPVSRRLPADLQRQLKERILVFLAEKRFTGCDGLEITDEMRVIIAARACLLLLNRRDHYYPRLAQVLVYPGPFIVNRERRNGIGLVQDESRVLSGESWAHGQVILSWPDVLEGAANQDDARDVTIHEFAHQLDQEKGFANGAPDLVGFQRYPRWSRVLGQEYGALQERLLNQEASLLDPYAATDPAEFFAVCSEAFFKQPQRMAFEHPALYGELRGYYRVDPAGW
ncbi:MAG: zinc-dependent peptidase [Betaproteobacteria bacterium]|nr:zinc-dependent peptidase [Betaproteobacteria bacterium]